MITSYTSSALPVAVPQRIAHELRRYLAGAVVMALGTVIGIFGAAWDIQWHTDVGPDTFFTTPHLLMYLGVAIPGLAALLITLLGTYAFHRREQVEAISSVTVPVLRGLFRVPVGFLIAGIGSALGLLAGFYDLWWHSVYGFDAVIYSPAHIALSLAEQVTIIGEFYAFAELLRLSAPKTWLRRGALLGFATIAALMICSLSFYLLEGPITLFSVLNAKSFIGVAFTTLIFFLAMAVTRRPWTATLVGGILTLITAGTWLFSLWATPAYADSLNLLMREDAASTVGIAVLSLMYPGGLLIAGLVVDLLFLLTRRLGWNHMLRVILLSGVGALVIALTYPITYLMSINTNVMGITLIVAPWIGIVGGLIGWWSGYVIRQSVIALTAGAHSVLRTEENV